MGGVRGEEDELQSLVMLRMQVIVEGANGPTTTAAEKILLDRKVLVIPVSVHTYISFPLSLSCMPVSLVLYRTCLRMLAV